MSSSRGGNRAGRGGDGEAPSLNPKQGGIVFLSLSLNGNTLINLIFIN